MRPGHIIVSLAGEPIYRKYFTYERIVKMTRDLRPLELRFVSSSVRLINYTERTMMSDTDARELWKELEMRLECTVKCRKIIRKYEWAGLEGRRR